ncbi:hypothetical protein HDE_02654 [Halotydeus destructor]|nr:hypothetical protein HDE_02654 [Halotydeus destructor]
MDSNYCSSPEGTGYVTAATCPMRSSGSSSVSCLTPPKSEHNGHSGHPDAHHLYLQSSMSSHNHQAAFSSSAEEVDDESLYTTHTESFYMQSNYHE